MGIAMYGCLRVEACGVHDNMAGLRGRRLRPARRFSTAVLRRLKSATIFLCTFGLIQKYQKVKHGEKLRVSSVSLAERARKTALFRTPVPGALAVAATFRSAVVIVQAFGLQIFAKMLVLPPFVTKRWCQKCPQGTSVGIGRRFSLSGHERLRCFAHPLRAFEPPSAPFPPAVHCGGCGARRATMISVVIIYFGRPQACLPPPAM